MDDVSLFLFILYVSVKTSEKELDAVRFSISGL